MKANEFIKKYGIDEAKKAHALSINAGHEDLELKELIESHELVNDLGGLIVAKRIADQAKEDNFNYLYRNVKQAIVDVEQCQ